MDKPPVTTLLERDMTRQEFLVTLGFGLVSVMGFSTIIKLLTGKSLDRHLGHRSIKGYGTRPYGRQTEPQ